MPAIPTILTVRTDKPDAELALYRGDEIIFSHTWFAERQLAGQILTVLKEQLADSGVDFTSITGIVVFEGPGSFTGLRIGITVANTLSYGLGIPIISAKGESWQTDGMQRLAAGQNDQLALPHYGAEPNISTPKK